MSRSIADQLSGRRYFIEVQVECSDRDTKNKTMRILCSDGKCAWQSSKSKRELFGHTITQHITLVFWNDLISLKPEGIDESIQSCAVSFALFGKITGSELKESDLAVEFVETGSGNLNITWKLKQMLGITVWCTYNYSVHYTF